MRETDRTTGYFLFSLDTELGWGYFDLDQTRAAVLSSDGSEERRSIEQLLDVLDEFGIVATWAVVGHLFHSRCEECDVCPILEWKGRRRCFEEVYGTAHPLWYGADTLEMLLTRGSRHEIAFHGYTHQLFDEDTMGEDAARTEIQEWLRVSRKKGVIPRTVIFPRNRIGYLRLFEEAGFLCYRGEGEVPGACGVSRIGRLMKSVDHLLALSSPPVYEPGGVEACGLVNLPSSQHFFGFSRGLEAVLDSLHLHRVRINRMIRGVKKAADERKIIHIWAHPHQFRTHKDFDKLRYLFGYVAEVAAKGTIQCVGMSELAEKIWGDHCASWQ
jgi:hypothetical protein